MRGARVLLLQNNLQVTCDSRQKADVVDGVVTSDLCGNFGVVGCCNRRSQLS